MKHAGVMVSGLDGGRCDDETCCPPKFRQALVPIVERLNQWDWQGHALPDAKSCEHQIQAPHPRTGTQCTNLAKYKVAGTPMCVRHAKAYLLRALDPLSSGN